MKCNICDKGLSEKVSIYSREKYGVELCFDHQKTYQKPSESNKVVTQPKIYQEELIKDVVEYPDVFKGMIFNQALETARTFEKTYDDVIKNLPNYYEDILSLGVKLTKRR